MTLQSSLFLILYLFVFRVAALDCSALRSLVLPNATITDAVHLAAASTFNASTDATCTIQTYSNTVTLCRIRGTANTSSTSSVDFEMWLPDTWYGRVLTAGNAGLGGCVPYPYLDHGAALNFATIGTNNGHDGNFDPLPFLMPSRVESVTDFSYRSIQVAAVLGKQIASTYYGTDPHHSYYNGCSTGGRQGISVASRYPDLFDGVVAGSPALDFNRFVGVPAVWASYVAVNTSSAIPLDQWSGLIGQEVLNQCDGIDGKVDGIINDPSLCSWNPDVLLCADGADTSTCLTQPQLDGLKKFYEPIVATNGDLIFPGLDPGAEADTVFGIPQDGIISPLATIWYNYAIYGQPTRPSIVTVADLEYAGTVDPAEISTWSNAVDGLGDFRDSGGKIITYHGTRDPAVPVAQSKRFHDLVSDGLSSGFGRLFKSDPVTSDLDDFYRLFVVPGMGHCLSGPGAWKIGQGALIGVGTNTVNETDHNLLLSLVDWVEGGNTPEVIIGTDDQGQEREHCLWPASKSFWNGTSWSCVDA